MFEGLPLIVAFYYVLLCFVHSAPGTHTFSVVSGTAFRLLHMLGFLATGASFSRSFFVFCFYGPWTVLAPAANF